MENVKQKMVPLGNGRRLGIERRQFSYTRHIPERRSGRDRRTLSEPAAVRSALPVSKTGAVLAA